MLEILGCLMMKKKLHSHDRELASIEKTMSLLPEATYVNMKKIRGWSLKKGRVLRQDMQE